MKREGKVEPMSWDLKIRSITKVERTKEKNDTTSFRLVARDTDGLTEVVIVSHAPFKGCYPGGVIKNAVTQSQKALSEFEPEKKEDPADED